MPRLDQLPSIPSFFSVTMLALASGCSSSSEAIDSDQGKTTGTSGFVEVSDDGANLPANLRAAYGAVGVLDVYTGYDDSSRCTVTHIGDGLALTAGHCMRRVERSLNARVTPRGDADSFPRLFATFPSREPVRATILDYELSKQRDYAILRLDTAPAEKIPPRLTASPPYGTKLTMLSFPDRRQPQGRPDLSRLQWSPSCTYDDSSGMTDVFGLIDVENGHFAHQCSSDPGSSGAAVVDAARLEVVGVHDGYLDEANYATKLSEVPLRQYLEKLPEPEFDLRLTFGDEFSTNHQFDANVTVAVGKIASVELQLVPTSDSTRVLASFKVVAPPYKATFDMSKLAGMMYDVRAIVTEANGAVRIDDRPIGVVYP